MSSPLPRRVLAAVSALALGFAGTLVAAPALAVPTSDPVPLSPVAGTVTNDRTPHFRWAEGTSTAQWTLRYRTEILNSQNQWVWGMAGIFNDEWTSEIPLPDGSYSWRVRGVDSPSLWDPISEGPWSEKVPFVVDTVAPVVAISAPAPGALVNATGVTVTGSVSDANPARVELRDNGSLVATDSSGSTSFSFAYVPPSGNRTLTVTAIDAAGNSGSASTASVTVTVDSDSPTGVVTYGSTAPINGNVMAYLTPSEAVTVTTPGWEDLGDGRWRKKFTKNALSPNYDQPVEFVDAFGNPGTAHVYIDWIDVIAPTAQVTYSTTSPTNGNIYAYLTPSEPITMLSTNWEARPDGTFRKAYPKNSKSPNWDQTVEFVDAAGNLGTAHVYIDWIDIVAPGAPQPINPQNGAMKADADPVLDWKPLADAVSYEVRVAQSPGRTPNQNDGELNGATATTYATSTDSYALSGLAEGWHWWQVRAIDAAGNVGPWSNIWSTGVDTTGPVAPQPVNPQNGLMQSNPEPVLEWKPVTDAVSYEVRYATSPGRTPDQNDGELNGADAATFAASGEQYTVTGLADGWVWWQVRGIDALGNTGPWSNIWATGVDTIAPIAPQPVNPQNGAWQATDAPILDWNAVSDAASYEVRYSTSPARTPNQVDGELSGSDAATFATSTDSYALSGLAEGWHWWQVRAIDAAGNVGPWSNIWSTGVDTTGPIAPQPISPENGRTQANASPLLDWLSVSDAVSYEVRTSTSPARTPDVNDGELSGADAATTPVGDSEFQLSGLSEGLLFWQVRGIDALGNVGPWSNIWSLGVDTVGPSVTLVSPADGTTLTTGNVTLQWSGPQSVAGYFLALSPTGTVDPVTGRLADAVVVPVTGLSYDLSGAPEGTYWWQIRGEDDLGNGEWSAPWSFTIDLPQLPTQPVAPTVPEGGNDTEEPTVTTFLETLALDEEPEETESEEPEPGTDDGSEEENSGTPALSTPLPAGLDSPFFLVFVGVAIVVLLLALLAWLIAWLRRLRTQG